MKTYTLEDVLDEFIGKKGTPERDRFDARAEADVRSWRLVKMLHDKNRKARIAKSKSKKVKISKCSIYKRTKPGRVAMW